MPFSTYLSYIIVSIIWCSMALLALVVYLLFPPEIYFWDKVCDKCSPNSAKTRYVIRFIFGAFKPDFKISKTSISIDIWSSRRSLIQLTISPKQLEQSVPKSDSNLKVCRFLLYRNEPLLDICNIIVNHNGISSINVTLIEVQDISAKEANIAYIGQPINCLAKDKAAVTQKYPSATKEERSVESALKPSQTLTALEYIITLFTAINAMLLMCVFVIPCSLSLLRFCQNYNNGMTSSLLAALLASSAGALIFVVHCLLYRYLIKRFLSNGKRFWTIIKHTIHLVAVLVGVVCGGMAALMGGAVHPHMKYWMFAIGIAIAVFFLFWISILSVIAYLIGFFSEPEDLRTGATVNQKPNPMDKTVRTDSEEEENSSDYYNSLMKTTTKVKSISQYTGVQTQKAKQKIQINSKTAAKVKITPSTESLTSSYLAKSEGSVKGTSTYSEGEETNKTND